jgi:integrase/recombinase XerD
VRRVKPKRHNGGLITPRHNGTVLATVHHAMKRYRSVQKTEADARVWIDATQAELGNQLPPLDVWQIRDAARALALLPQGVTLVDAAREWARHHVVQSAGLKDAVAQYLRDQEDAGLRPRSLQSIRTCVDRLAEHFDGEQVHSITTERLVAFLDAKKVKGPTRNNMRRDLSAFFAWAMRKNQATHNPASGIDVVRTDEKLPSILTPKQVEALFRAAQDHGKELIPLLAIETWAGIRPSEAQQLEWSHVLWEQKLIRVTPQASKVRQQRFVDAHPTLLAWLKAYPGEGRLAPRKWRQLAELLREVRRKAGLQDGWVADALRHSYATYHLAMFEDPGKTALQMGHRGTATLFRHYRGLATKADAEKFWNIRP